MNFRSHSFFISFSLSLYIYICTILSFSPTPLGNGFGRVLWDSLMARSMTLMSGRRVYETYVVNYFFCSNFDTGFRFVLHSHVVRNLQFCICDIFFKRFFGTIKLLKYSWQIYFDINTHIFLFKQIYVVHCIIFIFKQIVTRTYNVRYHIMNIRLILNTIISYILFTF